MKFKLNDPLFNEFVFDCLVKATAAQTARLPFDLVRWTHSPSKAKQFADTASLEKKIELLSRLGVAVSFWFSPPENMSRDKLLERFSEYTKGERGASVRGMIQERSFVFTDREVMATLVMMAQNCHSEAYMINRDYATLAQDVVEVGGLKLSTVEAARSALQEYKLLCRFVLNVLLEQEHVDGSTGFKPLELSILLFLMVHRNAYVDQDKIADYLNAVYKKSAILSALIRLRASAHVDRLPASKKMYTITALGIQVAGNYLMRVTNQTLNF